MKPSKPVYQSALGIETGDIATTSYGTGPYIVEEIIEVKDGTISLICKSGPSHDDPDGTKAARKGKFYLNGIRLVDGRYVAHLRDEIFIQKAERCEPVQLRLFE